jgi:hypothetical protein
MECHTKVSYDASSVLRFRCILFQCFGALCFDVVSYVFRRGNQYVKLKVQIPTKLTPRQKELIEEFTNPEMKAGEPAASSSGTGTGSEKSAGSKICGENTTFTIEQAWNRVKSYWKDPPSSSTSNTSKDDESSASAKAKM